ncbi:hypothetical protein [Trabulsiella odontotermitis]|nr:hypothetical protein [Trabulsiella odontotermitis]
MSGGTENSPKTFEKSDMCLNAKGRKTPLCAKIYTKADFSL